MCSFIQYDSAPCAEYVQLCVQKPQGALRIVPTPTFIDREIDIFRPETFHQVQNSCIPVTSKYCFVVPVRARDENLLVPGLWYSLGRGMRPAQGDDFKEVPDDECSNAKPSAPGSVKNRAVLVPFPVGQIQR